MFHMTDITNNFAQIRSEICAVLFLNFGVIILNWKYHPTCPPFDGASTWACLWNPSFWKGGRRQKQRPREQGREKNQMKTLKAHTEQRHLDAFRSTLLANSDYTFAARTSEWEGVSEKEKERASGKSKFRCGSRHREKRIEEEEGWIVWKEAEKEELHQTLVSRLPTDTPDDDEVDPSGTWTLPPSPPSPVEDLWEWTRQTHSSMY